MSLHNHYYSLLKPPIALVGTAELVLLPIVPVILTVEKELVIIPYLLFLPTKPPTTKASVAGMIILPAEKDCLTMLLSTRLQDLHF